MKSDNNLNYLLLTVDFPPIKGGIATFMHELWSRIPNSNSLVLTVDSAKAKLFDKELRFGIQRIKVPFPNMILGKFYKLIILLLHTIGLVLGKKINYIISGQLLITGTIGYICKKMFGIPYAVFVYGFVFGKYRLLFYLEKIVLKNADKIFAVSNFTKECFIKADIRNNNIFVLTPGVDTEKFNISINSESIIKKHNLQNRKILLTVARLDYHKGIDKMIELMPKVWAYYPDAVYLIVGKGPQEKYLKQIADKFDDKRIVFVGEVNDEELLLYYSVSDIFILLTRKVPEIENIEGFGIVLLEANACGKPVIAGKVGGAMEAVLDGQTGLLVDPNNDNEILNSIYKLLENKHLALQLGSNGRKTVIEKFQWKQKADFFINTIKG